MSAARVKTAEEVARDKRNVAIGLALLAFVVLVFVVTMVRLAQNVAANPGRPGVIEGSDRDG